MKRLTNDQIMDYLDGVLAPDEVSRLEAHLQQNAEDADLVRELRFANVATQDLRASEEFRVSENFWPNLRDQLGPAPRRSPWRRFLLGLTRALNPVTGTSRGGRLSVGAALAAIILALGFSFFGPKSAIDQTRADMPPSAADLAFIQSSADRHEAYLAAEPVVPGDASVRETGADDDDDAHTH